MKSTRIGKLPKYAVLCIGKNNVSQCKKNLDPNSNRIAIAIRSLPYPYKRAAKIDHRRLL